MGLTTGRTKMLGLAMDLQAVIDAIKGQLTPLLTILNESIRIDNSDDELWKAADDHLNTAITLADPNDKDAEILKARQAIRKGMAIDFSDTTKEKIKALIMPDEVKLEKLKLAVQAACRVLENGNTENGKGKTE